jgi:hypothetical protein
MHGHGEKPFLCTFEGCERGVPGNSFSRRRYVDKHMKRVHNRSPSLPPGTAKPLRGSKKRKNSTGKTGASKKTPTTASASFEKPRALLRSTSLSEQYQHGYQQLMNRTTQQMKSVPRMEGTISQQSPSVHSPASSGYQEIIFDSNSAHSSTLGSACSGRSGPLDKVAIAAMRLVKAVGACWKCKFLRKKVNVTATFGGGVNLW